MITRPQVPSQDRRATVEHRRARTPMTRAQGFPEPRQVGREGRKTSANAGRSVPAGRSERPCGR